MLKRYILASTLVTAYTLLNAYVTREQFYPSVVYLTSSKSNLFVLCNFGIAMLCLAYQVLSKLFLGRLEADEVHDIFDHVKIAVMETLLALTIFNNELNLTVFALFMVLLLVKVFHWLAAMRVRAMERTDQTSTKAHLRLNALIGFLVCIDTSFVAFVGYSVYVTKKPNVLLLFGFEYAILLVVLWNVYMKYMIHMYDTHTGGRWAYKTIIKYYIETVADLFRLLLLLAFFVIICNFYGMPLHLVRELSVTFYHLKERASKFYRYRKLTRNMNARFASATAAELEENAMCVICWDNMTVENAKKLPCGHIYHMHCLRTWFETRSSCPHCRAVVPLDGQAPPVHPAPAPAPVPVVAAAAAAAAAPVPVAPVNGVQQPQQQQQRIPGRPETKTALPVDPLQPPGLPASLLRLVNERAKTTAQKLAGQGVPVHPPTSNSAARPTTVRFLRPFPTMAKNTQASQDLYYLGEQQTEMLKDQVAFLKAQLLMSEQMLAKHVLQQEKLQSHLHLDAKDTKVKSTPLTPVIPAAVPAAVPAVPAVAAVIEPPAQSSQSSQSEPAPPLSEDEETPGHDEF